MANHDRILIVAMVAIVAIVGVISLRGSSGGTSSQEMLSGYVVESSATEQSAPPEPEPVRFAFSECGNGLCEVGFEDCRSCEKDCGPCI